LVLASRGLVQGIRHSATRVPVVNCNLRPRRLHFLLQPAIRCPFVNAIRMIMVLYTPEFNAPAPAIKLAQI
jgi:hypothetical protein